MQHHQSCVCDSGILPGSCLFVPEFLQPQHSLFCIDVEKSCVSLNVACCCIQFHHYKAVVASVYRSPSAPYKQCLEDLYGVLTQLSTLSQYVVLVGDVNIDLLQPTKSQRDYIDCLDDFQMVQLIVEPSRVSTLSSTLIDHIACSSSIKVSRVLQSVGVSDHRVQIADLDIRILRRTPEIVYVKAFRRCDWDEVLCCLSRSAAPWSVMEMFDDINDMWEFFNGILCQCLDFYAPLRQVYHKYSKRHTPWITDELLEEINAKHKAKRRAEYSKDPFDVSYYKSVKNRLKSTIRSAKFNYLRSLLSHARQAPRSAATLWSEVCDIIGRPKKQSSVIDPSLSLDDINTFFRTVAISADHQAADCYVPPPSSFDKKLFQFEPVNSSVVFSLLSKLNARKSAGPDNFSALFLQRVSECISVPLTNIYNYSLKTGTVPSAWKRSNVTPVHKGGDTDDPGNYRPISVVPIVAKILEKIVATQLSSFMEEHHLLHDLQGAYRQGRSADQILVYATDIIVQAMDAGKSVCAIFLDLRKAFDSLDHHLLLNRLFELGVSGTEL